MSIKVLLDEEIIERMGYVVKPMSAYPNKIAIIDKVSKDVIKTIEKSQPKTEGIRFECKPSLKPRRATKGSACYDFYAPKDFVVEAHSTLIVDSEVAVKLPQDKVLMLYVRSSQGIKHQVTLMNGTGVIDSDFFPNTISFAFRNDSDVDYEVKQGDRVMQGMFISYNLASDDEPLEEERNGGIGSTGK